VEWSLARGTRSAIPVRLLADRAFGPASATLFLAGAALYDAHFLLPLFFQQQRALTASTAGAVLACCWVARWSSAAVRSAR
jgi:hypothetical protein